MVVDIGGGTIDITVQDYDESVDKISVTLTPTGNAWGGTTINRAFFGMMEKIVDDKGFSRFLSGEKKNKNKALLNRIVYREFEEEKKKFGELGLNATTKDDVMTLELPSGFCKEYTTFMNDQCCDGVKFVDDDDSLDISYRTVTEKLFKKTIDAIIAAFKSALQSVNDVDTIYLVGGFGGSNFVYETLQTELSTMFNDREIKLLCPKCPHLAVCHGAVIWHLHPEIIQSRKADATYGIDICPVFDDLKHDVHYRYFDGDYQRYCYNDIFSVFIQKGETVNVDDMITTTLMPRYESSTQITTAIYSTDLSNIQYVRDKSGKLNVKKIGELKLDVPNPNNLPRSQRLYDVSMDFSGTEIKATAKYRLTGQEVKTVCDFLSAQY